VENLTSWKFYIDFDV